MIILCAAYHGMGKEGVECDFLYHFLTNWDTSVRSTVTNKLLYIVTDMAAKIEM